MRVTCPPNRFPCYYGIDFPTKEELIAAHHPVSEIERMLNLDSLAYLSIEGLYSAVSKPAENYCVACFNGTYPVSPEEGMNDKYRMEGTEELEEEMAGT